MPPSSGYYQELIEMQLQHEIGQLFGAFGKATTQSILPTLDSLGVLNMLNTKYIIYNKEAALVNPSNKAMPGLCKIYG